MSDTVAYDRSVGIPDFDIFQRNNPVALHCWFSAWDDIYCSSLGELQLCILLVRRPGVSKHPDMNQPGTQNPIATYGTD